MTVLYYFAGACSLVPHITARELGLDIAVKAAPRATDAGREDYLANISPLGKVPALQLDDGTVITQNLAIVEYMVGLAEAAGRVGVIYPKLGTLAHAQTLRWLSFANSDIHPAFAPLFGPQTFVKNAAEHPAVKELAIEKLLKLFAHVDLEYQKNDWIANNQFSPADVYIYVTYRWASSMRLPVAAFSGLTKMVAAIQQRPAVVQALHEQGVGVV